MLNAKEAGLVLVFLLLIEVGCISLAMAAWRWLAYLGVRLLPRERRRTVPWTGVEVSFAIVIFSFIRILLYWFLDGLGFYQWTYPPAAPDSGPEPHWKALSIRKALWATALAAPLQIGLILAFFRSLAGVRLYHLGLTARRTSANTVLGFLAWLALAPFVLFLHVAVNAWYSIFTSAKPEEHPLGELGTANLFPVEWLLLVFTAVVAAPVLEEFLYRGVLQPWFMSRSWGGLAAIGAALFTALYERASQIVTAWQARNVRDMLHQLEPAAFVLLMMPGWLLAERVARHWLRYPRAAGSIYGTSLLFAASHSFAWPQPIPLFVLSLGLGFLAYRTRSLVAPIVLHMLFNSIATARLRVTPQQMLPPGPTNGKEATSAGWSSSPDFNRTTVPGDSLPRRTYASAIVPIRGETTDDVTWPTSLPSRKSFVPRAIGVFVESRSPTSVR